MSTVTFGSRSHHRHGGRLFVLLVLTVLTGVLGMHGLTPGAAAAGQAGAGHEMAVVTAEGVPHADGACAHTDGGSGHPAHADGACAAAGTASAYTPPPLASAGLGVFAACCATAAAGAVPHGGRAPPDLSELQLLRI
jgi:hypothetical protein